ncbi:MAG: hypothetical protein EHM55_12320 [Acidobacteria bacterium]|nr:MAG: hypothetical protein EHM55_12320 [Acidobacteriota bacterium]
MDRGSSQGKSRRRLSLALSPPILVAAAGVLVVLYQWANARPLWLDEQMIALNLRDRGFAGLAGQLWLDQSAPLGWLVLQRFVLLVLGPSELALRAAPAAFGVATIAAALYIGQRWLTEAGSTIFVLLCSFAQWISFYAIELKSYSADTFFGLLLPALAVLAAGASRNAILLWIVAAAIGHWFSLGALLVLPACYAVIAISARRHRELFGLLAAGAAVLAVSIGLQYLLSLRHTQANETLQQYWQFAFPPAEAGLSGTVRWLYSQLEPFALKPGGTARIAAFWISAGLGFAVASARLLGVTAGLVVASGFGLAALRMMPLYERLSLWFVPALYLGIAMFADRAVWFLQKRPLKQPWMNLAAAGAIAAAVLPVCVDVVERGIQDVRTGRPRSTNHETDDRSAVAWLMRQRQPGDVLITTGHALPAIWWYGGVPISDAGGRQFADGGRILTAEYHESRRVCRGRELEEALDGRSRVQVYLGFVDQQPGFDDLLLERLSKFGTVTALRHFAGTSRAAVVDPAHAEGSNLFWEDAGKDTGTWLKGCIAVGQGYAW